MLAYGPEPAPPRLNKPRSNPAQSGSFRGHQSREILPGRCEHAEMPFAARLLEQDPDGFEALRAAADDIMAEALAAHIAHLPRCLRATCGVDVLMTHMTRRVCSK